MVDRKKFDLWYESVMKEIAKTMIDVTSLATRVGDYRKGQAMLASDIEEVRKSMENVNVRFGEMFKKMELAQLQNVVKGMSNVEAKDFLFSKIKQGMNEQKDDGSNAIIKDLVSGRISGWQASEKVRQLLRERKGSDYVS